MEVVFLGEHLSIGNFGHLAVVLAFGTSIISSIAYFFHANNPLEKSWKKMADITLAIHTISVVSIIVALFYIIHSHYFEYHYAWQHSSRDLPVYYMISCFWEGQEGSFLLWIFWQMVIANALVRIHKVSTSEVMSVLMLSQIALTSMLLGVKVFEYKIGSSPFELLRNAMGNAPLFSKPDYLSKIADGNGLNPLLQNYWMVIHPPTLFFGFATTIVPFAFAIAALWKRDFSGWIKQALPWTLVSVMVLGTGIIMGGFWAYESLSFGGYWAWDPVENASLIPWLILIAALHLMIVFKSTGNALGATFILTVSVFILVLYATFLTRSGILGNASVHSFTDLGMSGQLLVFLFVFMIIPIALLIVRWKQMPKSAKDEEMYTREFWMFIGALLLAVSSFQILSTTSIPVWNKIFNTNLAPPVDVIAHYNKWQMPMAMLIVILTGVAQLLKFKKNKTSALKPILISAILATLLSAILYYYFSIPGLYYSLLLFAACYGLIANTWHMLPMLRAKILSMGASVAHIGFAVLLIGVLVSSANKKVISINDTGMMLNPEFDEKSNREHLLLEKGKNYKMGDYELSYISDSTHWVNTYYNVHYKKLNADNSVYYEFDLYPNAQINPKMGLVANPDTKHYLSHDVFTYVSSVPKEKSTKSFVKQQLHTIKPGDSVITDFGIIKLLSVKSSLSAEQIDKLNKNSNTEQLDLRNMQVLLTADIQLFTLNGTFAVKPIYGLNKDQVLQFEDYADNGNYRFIFTGVNPKDGSVTIESSIKDTSSDFIIMKAIVFPWINLVWSGTIIMIIGFLMSIVKRWKVLSA